MAKRFFFLAPDAKQPIGGVFVTYKFARTLKSAGYDTYVLHQSPKFSYPYVESGVQVRHALDARRAQLPFVRRRERVRNWLRLQWLEQFADRADRVELGEDDVLAAPEVNLHILNRIFPAARKIIISQNHETHLRIATAVPDDEFEALATVPVVATSKICADVARRFGARDVRHVPVAVDAAAFPFRRDKRKVIAYMPRKNGQDARVVVSLLKKRGLMADYDFLPIENASRARVAEIMGDALMFLAFSEREGFGLPPAEAMASGCIVIGYRGQGGVEYFDDQVGVPVREGDLMGFIEAVERTAAEYRADPRRLDDMRLSASRMIGETYTEEKMRARLLDAWSDMFGAPDGAHAKEGADAASVTH